MAERGDGMIRENILSVAWTALLCVMAIVLVIIAVEAYPCMNKGLPSISGDTLPAFYGR